MIFKIGFAMHTIYLGTITGTIYGLLSPLRSDPETESKDKMSTAMSNSELFFLSFS